MARADLLKKLFRSYKQGDSEGFMQAAMAIVDDARKKRHVILANDLMKILLNGPNAGRSEARSLLFERLPKDMDRQMPLVDIRYPDRYLRDLILNYSTLDTLERVIREITESEVLEANGLVPSNKLLFCGPPGCGKTATAEALASELGLPLLYVRFDAVVSSLLGETAANLRKVFDYAEKHTWVVLFDEFDAIGRSRDSDSDHGELKRVVNSFLQLLDRFSGRSIIVAATNFESALDPALWRRFDEIIRFNRPSVDQIIELVHLKLGFRAKSLGNLGSVARELVGCSHADIERICQDAIKSAVLAGRTEVSPVEFREALKRHARRQEALTKIHDGKSCGGR